MRLRHGLASDAGRLREWLTHGAARATRRLLRCVVVTTLGMATALGAMAQAVPPPAPASDTALRFSPAERAWLAEHPRLRVFTKTEWAPIDLYTYEGQVRGLSGDYLALVAQRLGVTLEFTSAPTLAAALDALKRGEADVLPSVSRTVQREAFMDFSQPYLDVPNVYVARRGVIGAGPDQTMSGLRVAVEQGYAVNALIRERHPSAQIVEFAESAAALRGVSEGSADVYLGALPTTSFLVEKLLLTNLEVRGPWHSDLSALHFGLRKGDTVLQSLLDKALASITLAERQDIHRRWAPLHALLAEPSPPLQLSVAERQLMSTLPPLRVGYEVDYRPYTLRMPDGQLAGMANDYLQLIVDKLGVRPGIAQGGTWADIFGRARRGELDLLVAVAANEEREREFLFVGPWISTPNVLITRRDAAPVLSLTQFTGRRIAVLRDGQTAYLMRKLHPAVRLVDVDRREDLLAAVTNGQADGAFVNASLAAPALVQGLGSTLKMAAFFPELNSDLYFAVRRDQPALAAVLRRALASISEQERAAITARWAVLPGTDDAGTETRATLQRLLPVLATVLVALLVSLAWGLWLKREVAQRRRTEVELAQARDRAEALARVRHEFLADASHEIRTPVNAVVGALDQLSQQQLPAHGRELTALAQHAAQTLSAYVNNLLDLSKSDAGELKLVVQAESLQATLHSAAQAIAPIARARNIEVAVSIDPALAPRHELDAFRLRQIVVNLLSNAVKFSSESSTVQLRADVVGDDGDSQQLQICVVDRGIGISADRLPLLFTPYAQAGDSVAHRSGSTGLGLALCKRLVDAMGGAIAIESLPGIGTRAMVNLTATAARSADDAASAPVGTTGAAAPALRVLLADDDRVQQIVLTALLANAGCIVDVADDGSAAAALWLQHRHRLVITDLKMPIMGGIELARWLRAQPGGSNVLLIGTSADLDEIETALAAGIERLLSKPVQPSLINAAVREVQTLSAPQRMGI